MSLHWRKLTLPHIDAIKCQKLLAQGLVFIPIYPPLSWEFCVVFAYEGLMHVVLVFVSLCVHLPCWVWKTLLPWRYTPPLALTVSLPHLPHRSLSLDKRGVIDIPFTTENSKVSYSLYIDQLWVSALPSTARRSVSDEGWVMDLLI